MMVTTGGRETQRRRIVGGIEQPFFDVGFGNPAHRMAEFFRDQLRGVGIDQVRALGEMALLHQHAHDVDRALGHAVREFLDRDCLRER